MMVIELSTTMMSISTDLHQLSYQDTTDTASKSTNPTRSMEVIILDFQMKVKTCGNIITSMVDHKASNHQVQVCMDPEDLSSMNPLALLNQ